MFFPVQYPQPPEVTVPMQVPFDRMLSPHLRKMMRYGPINGCIFHYFPTGLTHDNPVGNGPRALLFNKQMVDKAPGFKPYHCKFAGKVMQTHPYRGRRLTPEEKQEYWSAWGNYLRPLALAESKQIKFEPARTQGTVRPLRKITGGPW